MKYITFNSACSYAGVANMLTQFDMDTDDRTIALEMGLPFLFSREEDGFAAGPMLQSARWFNLYLHPAGFHMEEQLLPAAQVPDFLKNAQTAMLGIWVENAGKHALTYTDTTSAGLHFLNNKWQQEDAPDELILSGDELLRRIDDPCMVATVRKIPPMPADIREELTQSITVLEEILRKIEAIAEMTQPAAFLRGQMNTLFRPLLLDGITMLDLLGEEELSGKLTAIQRDFLMALRKDLPALRLCEYISLEALQEATAEYIDLIRRELDRRKDEDNAI